MDTEALEAFQLLTRLEGIIPALEPAHALARVLRPRAAEAGGSPDGRSISPAAATSDCISVASYLSAETLEGKV